MEPGVGNENRHHPRIGDHVRQGQWSLRRSHRSVDAVACPVDGHVVQQDGDNNFVDAVEGAENRRDEAKERTAEKARQHCGRQHQRRRQRDGEVEHEGRGSQGARIQLTLGPDIPNTCPEGQRYCDANQQQRRGLDDGLGPGVRRPERPDEEGRKRGDRVLSDQQDEHAARQEGAEHAKRRQPQGNQRLSRDVPLSHGPRPLPVFVPASRGPTRACRCPPTPSGR